MRGILCVGLGGNVMEVGVVVDVFNVVLFVGMVMLKFFFFSNVMCGCMCVLLIRKVYCLMVGIMFGCLFVLVVLGVYDVLVGVILCVNSFNVCLFGCVIVSYIIDLNCGMFG